MQFKCIQTVVPAIVAPLASPFPSIFIFFQYIFKCDREDKKTSHILAHTHFTGRFSCLNAVLRFQISGVLVYSCFYRVVSR